MSFLNSERLTIYPRIFLVLYLLIGGFWILGGFITGHGALDRLGKPIGSDFVQFWTASQLALTSNPETVYEPATFYAAEQKVTNVFFPCPGTTRQFFCSWYCLSLLLLTSFLY